MRGMSDFDLDELLDEPWLIRRVEAGAVVCLDPMEHLSIQESIEFIEERIQVKFGVTSIEVAIELICNCEQGCDHVDTCRCEEGCQCG